MVSGGEEIKVHRVKIHKGGKWLEMRGGSACKVPAAEYFWFETKCMHEFMINIEYARRQKLKGLKIQAYDINQIPGGILNDLFTEMIEEGSLSQLEHLSLLNVNLSQFISGPKFLKN